MFTNIFSRPSALNTKIYFLFNFDIWNLFLFLVGCQIFAKSDGDPIENFENRDEADAKGDSSYSTDIGGKIKPGHLFRSRELYRRENERGGIKTFIR